MKLVEALSTYKDLGVKDKELNRIPEEGERFEITEERLEVLLGNNSYNAVFVRLVEDEEIVQSYEDVSEEVVQAVSEAIVEEAVENNKTVEEVVNEIVEESNSEKTVDNEEVSEEQKKETKKTKNSNK